MIKGNINNSDNLDYKILIDIIINKLKPDRTLIGFLQKILKAGYLLSPLTFMQVSYNLPLTLKTNEPRELA